MVAAMVRAVAGPVSVQIPRAAVVVPVVSAVPAVSAMLALASIMELPGAAVMAVPAVPVARVLQVAPVLVPARAARAVPKTSAVVMAAAVAVVMAAAVAVAAEHLLTGAAAVAAVQGPLDRSSPSVRTVVPLVPRAAPARSSLPIEGNVIMRTLISNLAALFVCAVALFGPTTSKADPPGAWTPIYVDRFHYSVSASSFNTWFWREDSAATHDFDVTAAEGCSADTPCVKLTAKAYPGNNKYTNSEMYNNSCVQGLGQIDLLKHSPWGHALAASIEATCGMPYPYQTNTSYLTPFGLSSSWMTGGLSHLEANPLAFTSGDVESQWKAARDIAFNNPYSLENGPLRLMTEIRAETKDQGGSRGWGFWNTSTDPDMMQFAWFMEYSVPEALQKTGTKPQRSVVMQSIGWDDDRKDFFVCSTPLPAGDDIYQWNNYSIEWLPSMIIYIVNGKEVAQHVVAFKKPMAFHNWVDNRNYTTEGINYANFPLGKDKSNYIRRFEIDRRSGVLDAPTQVIDAKVSDCSKVSMKDSVNIIELLKRLMAGQYGK